MTNITNKVALVMRSAGLRIEAGEKRCLIVQIRRPQTLGFQDR